MSALARWCLRHRRLVLGGWVGGVLVLAVLALSLGSGFKETTTLPDSESSEAYALLGAQAGSADTETGRIAWRTDGDVTSAPVRAEVAAMLSEVAALPGVDQVTSPYAEGAAAQLDPAHETAYADVRVDASQVDPDAVRDVARSIEGGGLSVELGGQAFTPEITSGGPAEGIGILAALLVLLLVFRSLWAASLPIVTGVAGVVTSLLFVIVMSHLFDLPSSAITMGSLIGLGVGIDYALFIVNRHRTALMAGASVEDAAVKAADTSGRAVVFAGLTVIVALLAMVVVGMSVLTGMGQAAAVTVAFTVLAALTLLPALLGSFGLRVLSKKQRAQLLGERDATTAPESAPTSRWARAVTRTPTAWAVLAVVVLAALAIPALSMRVGEADASTDKSGSETRAYYAMMSPAFGEGVDAPLLLVAETPDAAARTAFDRLVRELPAEPGVASVSTATPVRDGVSTAQVVPTGSSGSQVTQDLVDSLRSDTIPAAGAGSDLRVRVGGEAATNIDLAEALMSKLPLYLGLVAVLGFLLLAVAFRSLLVPLVGAVTNLATIVVGLGVITAIFQWGWGTGLLGVGEGGPVSYIVPVMIVGVMFGLSMDYQVFLVSRMHEEWRRTGDHAHAIRVGLTETAKVIATAATIMLCVFASFGFSGERIVASIGVGMALAVVVDAFVVRMVLVPALLSVIGRRTWAYPAWADTITPHVAVEGPAPLAELDPGSVSEPVSATTGRS